MLNNYPFQVKKSNCNNGLGKLRMYLANVTNSTYLEDMCNLFLQKKKMF